MAQPEKEDYLLPPHGAVINPRTLVMTWSSPGCVILEENFEGETFPPTGWQATSSGKGWERLDTILFNHWIIPAHFGHCALSNDDSAAAENNGNADFLITPTLDLTSHDSLKLTFDSYFDGAYGQSARVEYSTDGGSSWFVLEEISASLEWQKKEISLLGISGPTGLNNVKFAFHSCDNNLNGSGWAVDNVEIANSLATYLPVNYIVLLDSIAVDTMTNCSAFIPTIVYTYGEEHVAGVCAYYPEGNSDTVFIPFESKYLFPVYDLHTEDCGDYCAGLSWSGPYRPPDCWPWELQSTFQTPDYWLEGGCDAFGDFIYIVYENINRILKLDLEGNIQEILIIPGVPPLTDITHDDYGNFYGCCGTNIIYIMDFESQSLIGQFFAPVQLHAIAYAKFDEIFWGNNISTDITVFDQDQVFLTFPVGNFGNIHSLAYNDYSYDGEYLYAFSRDSTGCLLVEYDAWEGTPTGFIKDLSGLAPGGLAGGVYIEYSLYQPFCATLGGTIKNELVFNYSLEEFHYPGWTPQGIWGYYIYKDEEVFDSIEIWCNKYADYVWYPEDSLPRSHHFSMSVKYELDMFGLENQIAFSEKDGPVQFDISYGHELDFLEDWSSYNFSYNKWERTSTKWEVSWGLGNPGHAACFRGNPGTGPYSYQLLSYPFLPDSSEPHGISLSYDLKLIDDTPSGNQTLEMDLWNSKTREWQVLKEYHNDTVWSGFITESLDLTKKVKGLFYMIRFVVYGEDSEDIEFWVLDNIRVERTCPPPDNLLAEYNSEAESISLTWSTPFPGMSQWIHWDDSLQYAVAGISNGPDTWCDIAARWDSSMLEVCQGAELEQIAFIPSDPETHYILKVWTGDSARELKTEKTVANLIINQWNFIDLDDPVKLDCSEELWVGYSYSTKGQDPVSLDAGPPVDGFGNLCRVGNGEWNTLLNISPEWNGNINIQAYIHQQEKNPEGYRLFKSVDSGPYQYLAEVSAREYNDTAISFNLMHCFKVQSICTLLPDTITSVDSSESCVLPVNIDEFAGRESGIIVYPNPTEMTINIHAPELIEQIDIFDCAGRLAGTYKVNDTEALINLYSLKPGIYLIAARTSATSYFNKIVIIK